MGFDLLIYFSRLCFARANSIRVVEGAGLSEKKTEKEEEAEETSQQSHPLHTIFRLFFKSWDILKIN